jgi:hypothetical protein
MESMQNPRTNERVLIGLFSLFPGSNASPAPEPFFVSEWFCLNLITVQTNAVKWATGWSGHTCSNDRLCQSSWLQTQKSRVRFQELRGFLRSSGSGTGSTQYREDNCGATGKKNYRLRTRKQRLMGAGTRCADHETPVYTQKLAQNFSDHRRLLGRYSSLADLESRNVFMAVATGV